jgi:hypothetical protein
VKEVGHSVDLSPADQKVARMALHWVLHETYAPEWRPVLGDGERCAMATVLARLEAEWPPLGRPGRLVELVNDEVPPLRVAVGSFCRALWSVRREFEIITGLDSAVGESLIARLG